MNHLVIIGHPNPKSFNMTILHTYVSELRSQGHEVIIRDLYALGFDPVQKAQDFIAIQNGKILDDVKVEQGFVQSAKIITLISPIWWVTFTSMLKGYIDRVFSHGFAYDIVDGTPEGLLKGKGGMLITTSGATNERYEQNGFLNAIRTQICEGILRFSGIEVIDHLHFGGVIAATNEARERMLEQIREIVKKYFIG